MSNYRFLESLLNDFKNARLSYSEFIEQVENHYKEELKRITEDIERAKDKTRKETGAFKYDACYDECIKIINIYI